MLYKSLYQYNIYYIYIIIYQKSSPRELFTIQLTPLPHQQLIDELHEDKDGKVATHASLRKTIGNP